MTTVTPDAAYARCTKCTGQGTAHYLTCPELRLSPGWADHPSDDD